MTGLAQYWTPKLARLALDQFALDRRGYHGPAHWARVGHHAIILASSSNIDPTVPALFALFHDCCRENEHDDMDHGQRAGRWVADIASKGHLDHLTREHVELLVEACSDHSAGYTQAHPVVQVCWDADRLDLGRVGLEPDPGRLCTELAKEPRRIQQAYRWSQGHARGERMEEPGRFTRRFALR